MLEDSLAKHKENPRAWRISRKNTMLEDFCIPEHGGFPRKTPCLRIFRNYGLFTWETHCFTMCPQAWE
jgi:hypothetical protein